MNNSLQSQALALAIRCYGVGGKNNEAIIETLSKMKVEEWLTNKDICEAINTLKYEKEKKFIATKEIDKLSTSKPYNNKIPSVSDRFLSAPTIIVFQDLPVDFVRWYKCIILKEEKHLDACLSSIREGMAEYERISGTIFDIMHTEEYSEPVKFSENEATLAVIRRLCVLEAMLNGNRRPETKDNFFWRELLQNANDHIQPGSAMTISVNNNELVLEYPEAGFSVRDFAAVCLNGYSGSALSETLKTGNKGTGFKSIYNFFDEVVIESSGVRCTLSDKQITQFNNNGKELVRGDWEKGEKTYYPVPEFDSSETNGKTRLKLHFKSDSDRETALKHIRGENSELFEGFVAKKDYLFLDNINCFKINWRIFDRVHFMQEHYITQTEEIVVSSENAPVRFKKGNKLEDAKRLTVLFPNPTELDKDTAAKPIYCTLPVKDKTLCSSLYVNIPLLELEDSRNTFNEEGGWNSSVMEAALYGENSALVRILNRMNEENSDEPINLGNLYRYVVPLYNKMCTAVQNVRFVRGTTDGSQFKACCLIQAGFLPDYMYKRLNDCKDSFDGFSTIEPFAYYKSDFEILKGIKCRVIDYSENIISYISGKSGEDKKFDEWLKEAIRFIDKSIIVRAYLRDKVSTDEKYHNIDGEEKSVVLNEFMAKSGYIHIGSITEQTCGFFNIDKDTVIDCIKSKTSILSNPYEADDWKKIVDYLIENNAHKILADYSGEYMMTKTKTELGERLGSRLLFVFSAQKKIVPLSKDCYVMPRGDYPEIKHDSILDAKYFKVSTDWFQDVTELGEGLFDKEPDFVEKVLDVFWDKYGTDALSWIDKYKKTDNKCKDEVSVLLLKKFFSSNNLITWNPDFGELISQMEQKDLQFEQGKVILDFSESQLFELPFDIRDRFERMVSSNARDELEKKIDCNILEKTLVCKIGGNKRLFCLGKVGEETKFILFKEDAFGTMLRSLGCTEYSTDMEYKSMRETITPSDREYKVDKGLIYECVKKRVQDFYLLRNDQPITDHAMYEENIFLQFWAISIKRPNKRPDKIIAAGYNLSDNNLTKIEEEKAGITYAVCPVCGGRLFAEASLLKVGYVYHEIKVDENNTKKLHLPVPMCRNCRQSLNYANMISLDNAKNLHLKTDKEQSNGEIASEEKVLETFKIQPVELTLRMNYEKPRKIIANLSAFNRWLWDYIIETETHSFSSGENNSDRLA